MMRTPHSRVEKGKRVKVMLKDGGYFIDKFVHRHSKFLEFENHKISRDAIRAFIIVKGNIDAKPSR